MTVGRIAPPARAAWPLFRTPAMFSNCLNTINSYYAFYCRYFSEQWNHMTPYKYATLLIGIGAFGWVLMKAANKRS
jgi:hypothetical protein